mgnify:CR=1 FL=1
MKNYIKVIGILVAGLLVANCSSTTYNMKSEKGKVLNKVPAWYMNDFKVKKACGTSKFGKNKNKECIFGVGTAVSPDLQLAIEKAKMYAKSEMADIIMGKMNKQSKQFITELGKTETKTIVSEVESVLVNSIKDTPVRGYEIFAQDVTLTSAGYYRAWVGLRLPLGEYNKMYNYNIEQAVDAYNLKEKAKIAFEKVLENGNNDNPDLQ